MPDDYASFVARSTFQSAELRRYFPKRPRLNLGVQAVPFGEEGVLFLGGEEDVVMHGVALRHLLNDLLPLLDGEREAESIATELEWPVDHVATLLGNLFFHGLLEDGPAVGFDNTSPALEFLGRFCDATRLNKNRYAAFERLCQTTFTLFGPDDTVHGAANDLRETGARASICREWKDMPAEPTFCIGFHTQESDAAMRSFIDLAHDRGNDALYVGFGRDVWQLGPLLIPGHSLRYDDWEKQGATLGQAERAVGLAVALATQHATCVATGVISAPLLDRFMRFQDGQGETQSLARITTAGRGERGKDVFSYLTAVAQPPRRFLPPKSYQRHFQESNIKLAEAPLARLTGSVAMPLPADRGALPTLGSSLSGCLLGRILKMAFGHHVDGIELGRRIAPTGGNLSSPVAFLVVRDVAGVAPGIYRYNGLDHTLERIASAFDMTTHLFEPKATAQAYLATFGDFAKVRSKYGTYALSVVGYDGGIATQYVRNICSAFGLPQRELPLVDGVLLGKSLGLPQLDASLVFVEALALGGTTPAEERRQVERFVKQASAFEALDGWTDVPHAQPSEDLHGSFGQTMAPAALLRTILGRRSVRVFGAWPVPLQPLLTICAAALVHFRARLATMDSALTGRLYVVVGERVEGTAPGIYRVERASDRGVVLNLECRLEGQQEVEQLVNQHDVGQAPVLIVPAVGIVDVAERLGARGFMVALAASGAVVAQAWLDAMAAGFVGLAYGGLVESELRARTPSLDRGGLALLTLALGRSSTNLDDGGPAAEDRD